MLKWHKEQSSGTDCSGGGETGTHGSGQRSTWSPVSEGKIHFWLLRVMSSFWALFVSAL